jgi:hypothetical protein
MFILVDSNLTDSFIYKLLPDGDKIEKGLFDCSLSENS